MILTNVSDLKSHLGRAISLANEFDFIEPYVALAQDQYLLPAIGPEMLEELEQQYNKQDTLTAPNRILITKLQRVLAFYAYVKYLPFSLGNDGDNGLQEQSTEKSQPVRMGVLDKRQRESANNAALALESALLHLQFKKADYPTWTASATYKRANALFIRSATELTSYLPQAGNSYRLFLSLIPHMHLVETKQIKPLIGQAQYDDLKAKRLSANVLQPTDIGLLEAVGSATATATYARALYYLNVTNVGDGSLRILSDFDGIYNQKAVDKDLLMDAQRRADVEAQASLNSLKTYLTDFADQYPLYKNSDQYRAPGPNELPDNSVYKGVFRLR